MFLSAARYLKLGRVIVRDCGNGGIELKTTVAAAGATPDVYEYVDMSDVLVEMTQDHGVGVALNLTGYSEADVLAIPVDKPANVSMRNVVVRYTGASPAIVAQGFTILAWQTPRMDDCRAENCATGLRFAPIGNATGLTKTPRVRRFVARGPGNGVSVINTTDFTGDPFFGEVRDALFEDCDVEVAGIPLSLAAKTTRAIVRGGRWVRTATTPGSYAIGVQSAIEPRFERAHVEAQSRAIQQFAGTDAGPGDGGVVRHCRLVARASAPATPAIALNVTEGVWRFVDNELDLPATDCCGWLASGGAVVNAARNRRGVSGTRPVTGGSPGDFFDAGAVAGAYERWCVTGIVSTAAATWKGAALLEA